ncbi:transposase [Streptomyces sp. SAS_276]|uniref:transposase n=1 Tax=Streptomyces sp. SAS_276 TaxID=3412745 RepID=UPI00403C6CA6
MTRHRLCPSDCSDARWELNEPTLTTWRAERRGKGLDIGRPPEHDLRRLMDAILHVDRTRIAWRFLPHDFPPWETVRRQSRARRAPRDLVLRARMVELSWTGQRVPAIADELKCSPQKPAHLHSRRRLLPRPSRRLVAHLPQGRPRQPVLRRPHRDRTRHAPRNIPAQLPSPALDMGKTRTTNPLTVTPVCVRRLRSSTGRRLPIARRRSTAQPRRPRTGPYAIAHGEVTLEDSAADGTGIRPGALPVAPPRSRPAGWSTQSHGTSYLVHFPLTCTSI